jgi:hypothetical protein
MNKRIALFILAVVCACLAGCGKPAPTPAVPNALPPSLMLDEVLYYYTGNAVSEEMDEDASMGTIASTVPLSEMPTENGQTNMTHLLGCPYAQYGENVVVLMEEQWMLFETRDTD